MAVTSKHPYRQRADMSFCFLYNEGLENYSVKNTSRGAERVYSRPKVYISYFMMNSSFFHMAHCLYDRAKQIRTDIIRSK